MKHYLLILFFIVLSSNSNGQFIPLTFSFDTIEPVYIDTLLVGNIWQIGRPQKIIFDSAFNGQRAILTDTTSFYPNNNLSEFIIKTPTYMSNWGGINFYFNHKYDTDTISDGGTIDVSYDGINWENILTSQGIYANLTSFSIQDTVSSLNEPGFSGRSANWSQVYYYWNYPNTDTIRIKFKFASDGINNNREGWMIDHIYIFYDLGIGFQQWDLPSDHVDLYPNPTNGNSILSFNNPGGVANRFTLFNNLGEVVSVINNITTDHVLIDCTNISNGMYFYSLETSDNKIATGKLIVDK